MGLGTPAVTLQVSGFHLPETHGSFFKSKQATEHHQDLSSTRSCNIKQNSRASLVAQWLGVRLPMRGTRVRAPVREDPTCRGAAGPVGHGR